MPDTPPSVDGLAPASTVKQSSSAIPPGKDIEKTKRFLVLIGTLVYLGYALWCGVLIMILPTRDGSMAQLVSLGSLTAFVGCAVFVGIGAIGILRIRSNATLPASAKQRGLIRSLAVAMPGLLLSAATVVMINREPTLTLDITKPAPADLVAPVAVTFSVEQAVLILETRGQRAIGYKWDVDGDGKTDRETVVPTLTTTYQREGVFSTAVTISFSGSPSRKLVKRMIIQKAVFTVDPLPAIVGQPVTFDAANLVQNRNDIDVIAWDFDNDGKLDVEGKETTAVTTFYQTGTYPVGVTVKLTNATESQYQRAIEVVEPPPLPFPIEVITEPKNLKSPAPFVVVFSVQTDVPLAQVQWVFGDGERAEGKRVAHTFNRRGTYSVLAKARSASGVVANVATQVKIAEPLTVSDLTFKGSPLPTGDLISGEVPLNITLDPQTSMQFITFAWEVPDATEVGSTEGQLQAIYRKPGNYKLTLIAEDAEEKVLRRQYRVEVKPASSLVTFEMQPQEGIAPLQVDFDASESGIPGESISGFEWDFGDSSPKQFGGAQTQHVFEAPGTYQVSLRVRTTSGNKEQSTMRTILVRAPSIEACLLASRMRGPAPLYVKFESTCTTGVPQKFEWNFGDGGQSEEQNPIYKFEKAGTYTVQLTVTDVSGRTSRKSVIITVE